MNLKQLEYFRAIAEEGQITAAARRLHISQPPLSYELAQLERELGCQLVRRGPRGVTLTEAGRLLYERAGAILRLTGAAAREVSSVGGGTTGTASVAVASSCAGLAPTARLAGLASHGPDVSLELREAEEPKVVELVGAGLVDAGVVRTPFASQGLRCRYAHAEPLVAVMPPSMEVGAELEVGADELASVPIACTQRTADLLGAAGASVRVACLTQDARTTCSAAAAGLAVGLVPRSLLRVCDTGDAFIKTLPSKALETRAAVVWKADRTLSPLAERVIALLGDLS